MKLLLAMGKKEHLKRLASGHFNVMPVCVQHFGFEKRQALTSLVS